MWHKTLAWLQKRKKCPALVNILQIKTTLINKSLALIAASTINTCFCCLGLIVCWSQDAWSDVHIKPSTSEDSIDGMITHYVYVLSGHSGQAGLKAFSNVWEMLQQWDIVENAVNSHCISESNSWRHSIIKVWAQVKSLLGPGWSRPESPLRKSVFVHSIGFTAVDRSSNTESGRTEIFSFFSGQLYSFGSFV